MVIKTVKIVDIDMHTGKYQFPASSMSWFVFLCKTKSGCYYNSYSQTSFSQEVTTIVSNTIMMDPSC